MPSFVCDVCQETVKKPKLDQHKQRCRMASFSCIDCYKSFKGDEYRSHTSCITEVQKYHGKPQAKAPRVVENKVFVDRFLEALKDALKAKKEYNFKELRKVMKVKGFKKDFDSRIVVKASEKDEPVLTIKPE